MCSPELENMTGGGFVPQPSQAVEFDLAQIIAVHKLGKLSRERIKKGDEKSIEVECPEEFFEEISRLSTPGEVYRYFRKLGHRLPEPNR